MNTNAQTLGEEALKISAEQIQDLYENAPCGYHSIDADGVILRMNETELNWLGFSREEILGTNLRDLLNPSDIQTFEANFAILKSRGEIKEVEFEFVRKDGGILPVALSSTAIRDHAGNFLMSRSTTFDLTGRRRADAELRQTRNFLGSIIDNIPNMVFVKESEGLRFVRLNKAGEKLLGMKREEIIGKNDYDFFPKEEADFFTAKDREVLESGTLLDIPEESIHTLKGTRLLHTKKIPLADQDGNPKYLLGISEDITDLRRAEEELNRFFNLSTNLFCIAGFDGYFKRLNPAWEALLGYKREELMARQVIELVHPEEKEATIAEMGKLCHGRRVVSYENRCRCRDGSYRWLLWESRSVPEEALVYSAAHDCTERILAEQALKQSTEELRRSNEELEQFAYVASHDLQEPLRMVGSYTRLLGQRYKGRLGSDADKYIEYAVDGSKRMQMLIQDLLAYSRVGSSAKSFKVVDCEKILANVLKTLDIAMEEAQAVVTHDPLPKVHGESLQLTQLFQNLIANAIKFHGDKSPKIHVAAKKGNGEWIFSIRDNGIGIYPEYFERIFTIFQRLHTRGQYQGTGIGLAICKKIVQRHGGRIWVESQPGEGSVFSFSIPHQ